MSIPATWSTRRLGDCVELLSGGTPSKQDPAFWNGDIPWVSCKDMKVERLHSAEDCITELGAQTGTRLVPAGTVLIVVRGMILAKDFPVGRAMREMAFNQDLKAVVCRPNVGNEFLFYWFLANSHYIKGIADEAAHGTKRIQTDRLLALPVRLPPPPVQQRIAAILSAYDDLVENNERRMRILEEMAQNLYREWFVSFRFPGHKKVKMVESPLGGIIEFDPSVPMDRAAVVPFVSMEGLSKRSMVVRATETRRGGGGARFQNGDTLLARITPCLENGKTGFVQCLPEGVSGMGSTEFIVMRGKTVPPEFVYLLARSDEFRAHAVKSMTGATGRQRVQVVALERFEAAIPPAEVIRGFGDLCRPLFSTVYSLARRNAVLRQTRDLLLPRLISGELDVSELPIKVPED